MIYILCAFVAVICFAELAIPGFVMTANEVFNND